MKHNGLRLAAALLLAVLSSALLRPLATGETVDYRVMARYPHDSQAFTQGLYYEAAAGVLYESVGRYGLSDVRKVDLKTGQVLQQKRLPAQFFAEGLTVWNHKIFVLTWREKLGLVLDQASLDQLGTFRYDTQGWGLTHDASHLIMSDGSASLSFLDPETFQVVRRVVVREGNQPVALLNELEWVNGELYANIWRSTDIVVINPTTGQVKRRLSLSGLVAEQRGRDVLNGIAYDPQQRLWFVTGKLWSALYAVEWRYASEIH